MKSKLQVILWIFVVLFFITFCIGRYSKKQDETSRVLLLSHSFGQSHPIRKFVKEFAEQIEAASGNSIKIEVYDSSQLGAEPQFVEQIRLGVLHGGIVSNQTLARFSPDFLALQYPYVFKNEAQGRLFLNTSGEAYLKNSLEKSKANLVLFCTLTNGMNGLYFVKEVGDFTTAQKKRDFYFASSTHPIYQKFFAAQGLLSIPIAKGEIYSALQMRMLHAGENTLPGLVGSKHHETANIFVATEHSVAIFFFVMNSRVMDSLNEKERILFASAWKKAKANFEKTAAPDYVAFARKNNVCLVEPAALRKKEWQEYARQIQSSNPVPWSRTFYSSAENFGGIE